MPKGKEKDLSTDWSDYVWNDDGFWYSSRRDSSGKFEYRYPQAPEDIQKRERTPRTPGPSIVPTNESSGQSHLDDTLPTDFSDPTTAHTDSNYSHSTETLVPGTGATLVDETSIVQPAGLGFLSTRTFSLSSSATRGSEFPAQYLDGVSPPLSLTPSTLVNLAYNVEAQSFRNDDNTSKSLASDTQNLSLEDNKLYSSSQTHWQAGQQQQLNDRINSGDRSCGALDLKYCMVPTNERSFWRVGRVFMMLWTEVARSDSPRNETHISTTYLGGLAHTEIRRFVIMQDGYGSCICSPIHTYKGQGTLKPNLPETSQHAIIYTGDEVPHEMSYEDEGGNIVRERFTKDPIQVMSEQPGKEGQLDPASRLNYSKVYTVEKYVQVLNIGMVDTRSMASLESNSFVQRKNPPQAPHKHRPKSGPGGTSGGSSSKNRSGGDRSKHGSGGGSRPHHTKDDTRDSRRQGSKKR